MATTSTNKSPCLIDRPFLRGARITNATATVSNPSSPSLGDLIQLVRVGDLPTEDGAFVEDITIVSNEDYPDRSGIRTADIALYVYAPNQASPSTSAALMVGRFEVGLSGSTFGYPLPIQLFAVNAPVPQVGDTTLIAPIQIGKGEGLYLEKGYILCAGYLGNGPTSVSGGLSPSGITIWSQGGFY
jgi:hypothetical protein